MSEVKETDWILLEDQDTGFHVWGCRECQHRLSTKWLPPNYLYCPYCGLKRVKKNDS